MSFLRRASMLTTVGRARMLLSVGWSITLCLAAIGCESGPPAPPPKPTPLPPEVLAKFRSEPWRFTGRFATWQPTALMGESEDRVYTAPDVITSPLTGPALLSEVLTKKTPNATLDDVAATYDERPGGGVVRVLMRGPDVLIFEGHYDYVSRDAYGWTRPPTIQFHSVVRLAPIPGTQKVAALTYTQSALPTRLEVAKLAEELRAQTLAASAR